MEWHPGFFRHPFAVISPVVQIEHGGNGVDAQPVNVELLAVIECIGYEETDDFRTSEIKGQGSPAFVFGLPRGGIFIKGLAIKGNQTVFVFREVSRNPVDDHANVVLVCQIDEILQIFRRSVAGSRTVVAGYLIAPGSVEGMLHNR